MSLSTEWKNGDECYFNGKPFFFVGVYPIYNYYAVVIESDDSDFQCVPMCDLKSPEQQSQQYREDNGRAYYNLVVSVCMGWDGREHLDWDDLSDSDKGIHIELAEKIDFKASGNE